MNDPLVLEARASLLRATVEGDPTALNLPPTKTNRIVLTNPISTRHGGPTEPDASTPRGAAEIAWKAIKDSPYNDYRKFTAATRMADLNRGSMSPLNQSPEPSNERSYWANLYAGKLFESDLFAGENEPLLIALVWRAFDNSTASSWRRLHHLIVQTEKYPWAVLVARGEYHIEAAWDARGGGLAHTVTDEGWADFREHLRLAGLLLVNAHELRPDRPEAASSLISVVMGGQAPDTRDEVAWLRAAIAAQSDYTPAWSAATWAARPRWGGSHRKMLQIGQMALETEAFDTSTPYHFFQVLNDIASEMENGWIDLRGVGRLPELSHMYDGLIAEQEQRNTLVAVRLVADLKAERLATAWALGDWDLAADELDDPSVSAERVAAAFSNLGGFPEEAFAEIALMTGPFAKQAGSALDALRQERNVQAADELEALLAAMPEDIPARVYLEQQANVLVFSKLLESSEGEWIDMPTKPSFWKPVRGRWSFEQDAVVFPGNAPANATSTNAGQAQQLVEEDQTNGLDSVLLFAPQLEGDYEVRVVVDVEGDEALAGLAPAWDTRYPSGTLVNPKMHRRRIVIRHISFENKIADADGTPLLLWGRVAGDRVVVEVNEIADDQRGTKALSSPNDRPMRVGLAVSTAAPGETAVFSKLQIRRISVKL